jgi:hypothetical protein
MILLGLLIAGLTPTFPQSYFEVPDVPTELPPGLIFHPWDIVDHNGDLNTVAVSIQPPVSIDGAHQLLSGNWLISVESATEIAGTPLDPRDVVEWDGGVLFAPVPEYAGALALIPETANVDAVLLDPAGAVVVSFDVPTSIGAGVYEAADLVRYNGSTFDLTPYFDASMVGIPRSSNLTAAAGLALVIVFSLDIPTAVGDSVFLPGQLLSWDGATLDVFDLQDSWPSRRTSRLNALAFDAALLPAGPGEIASLQVERAGDAALRLTWSNGSCQTGTSTGIYQGTLASLTLPGPYDHTLIDCTDEFPFLEEEIPLPAMDTYFLVVPQSDATPVEGSYGRDGTLNERPPGFATCTATQDLSCPSP